MVQFCFNLLTRSRRITYDNLRLRDPEFASRVDAAFAAANGLDDVRPALLQPFRLGPLDLVNRVIVSPMDMYSATDGIPGAFHLVHLGSKAMGGAGPGHDRDGLHIPRRGRITPGCTGLWSDDQRDSWSEVVDFVHANSAAKIGVQLGHSGRKGSTKLMWDGIDEPLPEGNWAVVGPSALPYGPRSQVPGQLSRPATRGDPGRVRGRRRAGGHGRVRPARTALRAQGTCCPPSCRPSPISEPTTTGVRWRTASATR